MPTPSDSTHLHEVLAELTVHPGDGLSDAELPRVCVVILNHNGRHHLQGCFESLAASNYPRDRFEVLLIDNGSDDGSHIEMKAHHSWVRFVPNERNLGFAGGCNQGAELAGEAEVLVFLNNDMRVEPDFLRELVGPLVRGECQATQGKMYSWDGKLINSCGGGMNFHGIGIQDGYMEEPTPRHDIPRKTLFPCGGAMAIGADLYRELGGFDGEFFAYYEDVDLGWRMWIQGHEAHYAPKAICYHHHSSTSRAFPMETVRLLQVRNPILACFKNYDDDNLQRMLGPILALATRRLFLNIGLADATPFRIEAARAERSNAAKRFFAKVRKRVMGRTAVSNIGLADLVGINDLLGNWDHWMERRGEVQGKRKRSDSEIFGMFLKPLWCVEGEPAYGELQAGLSRMAGLDEIFEGLTAFGADPNA